MKKTRGLSVSKLMIFSVLYSCVISWSYGNSYSLYTMLSLALIIPGYYIFGSRVLRRCTRVELFCVLLIVSSVCMGLVNGTLVSCIQVNATIVILCVIARMNINYENLSRQICRASVFSVICIVVLGTAITMNSNSKSFLIYIAGSVGIMWFVVEDGVFKKILAGAVVCVSVGFLVGTGSRNAAIVTVVCLILVILPSTIYKKAIFSRIIYIPIVLATVFAMRLMIFVFGNIKIMERVTEFTNLFSDKAYSMSSHLDVLIYIEEFISSRDLVTQLFGSGTKIFHCHNLFYQCVIFYGYVGTIVIYGIYAYIFEQGFKLYRKEGNKFVLACCIILLGHFLMQIGEVYMLGVEQVMLGALVPAGVILNQTRRQKIEKY